MRVIKLTKGYEAIVDSADYDQLSRYQWYAHPAGHTVYARAKVDGKLRYMHRILADCGDGSFVDHIDHNGLNNKRDNLRTCTKGDNLCNRGKPKNGVTSRYKGVHWVKRDRKYCAQIKRGNVRVTLGRFASEAEAAAAYDEAARKYFGEFAYLNLGA